MASLEFFLAMVPPTVTDQQKGVAVRNGKPCFYVKEEVRAMHDEFARRLRPHVPPEPYDCAVRLYTQWCFPMIQGVHDGQPKHTAPDTDNLQKGLKDVMERLGFFVNDSRVAEEVTGKYWAEIPGVWIRLEEL